MKGALDVHGALLSTDVPHEVVRLATSLLSADDLPGALGLDAGSCVAVRCYVAGTRLVAVLVPAGAVPDPAALLDALGATSVRAATPAEVNAATDFAAGLVSPVCLPPDVEVLAEAALAGQEVLYAPVGEGRVVLGIRADDLLATSRARLVPLAARPLTPAERPGWSPTGSTPPEGNVIDLRGSAAARRGSARRPAG